MKKTMRICSAVLAAGILVSTSFSLADEETEQNSELLLNIEEVVEDDTAAENSAGGDISDSVDDIASGEKAETEEDMFTDQENEGDEEFNPETEETADFKETDNEVEEEKDEEAALIEEMKNTQITGVYFTNTYVPGESMAQQVRKQMAWTYPGQYSNDTAFLIEAGFAHRICNEEYWFPNPDPAGFFSQVIKNTTAVVYGIEDKHAKTGDLVFFCNKDDKSRNNERKAKNARKIREEISGNIYTETSDTDADCGFDKAGIVIERNESGIVIAYYDDAAGITSIQADYDSSDSMKRFCGAKVVSLSYYTNENIVFRYLQNIFPEFNKAAICGIMSNIRMESGFNQYSTSDDGTSCGLCMWHNTRAEKFLEYMSENGYDKGSLKGQLMYLRYEMTADENYAFLFDILCNCEDNASGAYSAAQAFCSIYEAPLHNEALSVLRGRIAKDIFYPFYSV